MSEQLQFPFPSLDLPGRITVTAAEIAERWGCDEKHVRNLIAEGAFPGLDIRSPSSNRGSWRVPIESYRDFVVSRMTGPRRVELLRNLPKATLRETIRELTEILKTT